MATNISCECEVCLTVQKVSATRTHTHVTCTRHTSWLLHSLV